MLVSLIVPGYNVEKYISNCLTSILKQTYREIEVVVVNDGSTDNSRQICAEFAAKDQRVILVDKPNGGLADARNVGIDHARGEYLAFIDSDDFIAPNFVEALLATFEADETIEVAVSAFYLTDDRNQDYEVAQVEATPRISGRDLIARMLRCDGTGWHYVIAWNKLYRSTVFTSQRYDVGRVYEDDFISHRLFYDIPAVAIIDVPLYHYVHRHDSIMQSGLTDAMAQDFLDLCTIKLRWFEEHEDEALARATKRKLLDWVLEEPTRHGQLLSPAVWRRIQRTYRDFYSPGTYLGDARHLGLSFLGYLNLQFVVVFRSLLSPIKHLLKRG